MGQLVQCRNVSDAKTLLEYIFTVAISETEGKYQNSSSDTPCEIAKTYLKYRIATGESNCEDNESEMSAFHFEFLQDSSEGSPFQKWATEILSSCKENVNKYDGDRDNLQHLPELAETVVKMCKLLPLWSGIMVPFHEGAEITATSSAVESSFNDIKHRIFENQLPLRIDDFIFTHAKAISGSMKIAAAPRVPESKNDKKEEPKKPEKVFDRPNVFDESEIQEDAEIPKHHITNNTSTCPECSLGNFPSGAHKCLHCKLPVHVIFEECSKPVDGTEEGYGQERICRGCYMNLELSKKPSEILQDLDKLISANETNDDDMGNCPECSIGNFPNDTHKCYYCNIPLHSEHKECSKYLKLSDNEKECISCISCYSKDFVGKATARESLQFENWRGQGNMPPKKRRLYLDPSPEWRTINLSENIKSVKVIGLLKNGNRKNLKPIKLKKEIVLLTNTCAFDSLVQIICAAYCDSEKYQKIIDTSKPGEMLTSLVHDISSSGISANSYRVRAGVLRPLFPATILPSKIVQIATEAQAADMVKKVLGSCPSVIDTSKCDSCDENSKRDVHVLTVEFPTVNLAELQDRINVFMAATMSHCQPATEHPKCYGLKTITRTATQSHLFIEPFIPEIIDDSNVPRKTMVGTAFSVNLEDVPKVITIKDTNYSLRGVIGFSGGREKMTNIGHYVGYCHRPGHRWEAYDDMKDKKDDCGRRKQVTSDLLFYTV